jgi:hypothetical protein
MKVIFLDIDGVLNTFATRRRNGIDDIDPSRLEMLHQLVDDTGAKVVLSSTWRTMHTIEDMSQRLRLQLIGYTPYLSGSPRGEEIDRWFYDNEHVDSFVILDDRNDMEPHRGRLVQTKETQGLTWRHCAMARRMLMS